MRPPVLRLHADELVTDCFAGGGGASLGLEMALGRSPDIAINHDRQALAMHEANHPQTRHLQSDVWDVDPVVACGGRPVGLAWFSPTCIHFSRAKGGPLKDAKIRSLAWVVVRWARAVKPRIIILENVTEFATWGPLRNDGTVCPIRRGNTFRMWLGKLRAAGYEVEMRELRACDYGAPTTRNRLFIIARSDGRPIVWPTPTHGLGRVPHRAAAECIDWSLPCPSIFDRRKPLAEKTLRRIARGVHRFVLGSADPFLVPVTHAGDDRVHSIREPMRTITAAHRGEYAFVSPTLIQTGYGEREGQAPRSLDLSKPLGTVVAGGAKHALVAAFLAKHFGGHETPGSSLARPFATVTCRDHHALVAAPAIRVDRERVGRVDEVRAFLTQYNGQSVGQSAQLPLGTVTTRDRFGVVTVHGEPYAIADLGMRMLVARELYRAQGFPDSYEIAPIVDGKPLTKEAQIRMCGNSVSPPIAAAIVAANVGARAEVAA